MDRRTFIANPIGLLIAPLGIALHGGAVSPIEVVGVAGLD